MTLLRKTTAALCVFMFCAQQSSANNYVFAMQYGFLATCSSNMTKSCAVPYYTNRSYYFMGLVSGHLDAMNNPVYPAWCSANPDPCAAAYADFVNANDAWGYALEAWGYWENQP